MVGDGDREDDDDVDGGVMNWRWWWRGWDGGDGLGGDVVVEVVNLEGKVMKMVVIESGSGVEIGGEWDGEEEKGEKDRWPEVIQPAEFWLVMENGQIPGRREVSWGEREV